MTTITWRVTQNQDKQVGCKAVEVGKQGGCLPYTFEGIEKIGSVWVFTLQDESGNIFLCKTISTSERPMCLKNGKRIRAPMELRVYCWKDTVVVPW